MARILVADDDAQGAAGRASDREWLAPPPIAAGFRDSTGRGAGAATPPGISISKSLRMLCGGSAFRSPRSN